MSVRGRAAPALLAAMLLGGCAGDFDRPRAFFFTGDMQPGLGGPLVRGPGAAAFAGLTDDERLLRDMSFSLLAPPDGGDLIGRLLPLEITRVAVVEGHGPQPDHTAYAERLVSTPARSEEMRYARLLRDIRNDTVLIDEFLRTANRVADMDRKRDQSLSFVTRLSGTELAAAKGRIHENGALIRKVLWSLEGRIASYRYALERLVISAPSPTAAEAERALSELKHRIAQPQPGLAVSKGA